MIGVVWEFTSPLRDTELRGAARLWGSTNYEYYVVQLASDKGDLTQLAPY